MRIRTVKPEFFFDEDIARLPPYIRLMFIGLWGLADKEGRLEDRPAFIRASVFPYEPECDVDAWLDVLAGKFLVRYEAGGRQFIWIRNFKAHQRISGKESETESRCPSPPREATEKQPRSNRDHPESQEGKGREGKGREYLDRPQVQLPAKKSAPNQPPGSTPPPQMGGLPAPDEGGAAILPPRNAGNGNSGPLEAKSEKYQPTTPIQQVVCWFKVKSGTDLEDRAWDKVYFPRFSKPAKELLLLFGNDIDKCLDCIDAVVGALEKKGLSWTPETIVKHASDWKNGRLLK